MKLIDLSSQDYLVVNAGRIFDGTVLTAKENIRIHIWDGIIQFIEKKQPGAPDKLLCRAEKKRRRMIGNENLTLLPGFIDCHVHLALDGVDFHESQKLWENRPRLRVRVQEDLLADLSHGIVAVRDGGDRAGIGLACRKRINKNELKGPIIMASGKALRKPDKYGSFLGPGVPAKNLQASMKKLVEDGINQVKVIVSGIVSFKEYRKVGKLQYDLDELRNIVDAAGEYGLKVMAHASSDEAVKLCINAGVHSIEHGYFACEDSLHAMAQKNIAWVPTVVPVAAWNQGNLQMKRPVESALIIERTYRRQLRMLAIAHRCGVKLGVGTDAGASGIRHGSSFLQELRLFREAGLTAEEVLTAATKNGASIIGLEESLGIIQPGKPAFLIAVAGDPCIDLDKLSDIKYLIRPVQGTFTTDTRWSA